MFLLLLTDRKNAKICSSNNKINANKPESKISAVSVTIPFFIIILLDLIKALQAKFHIEYAYMRQDAL